jgi:hypothetical protein
MSQINLKLRAIAAAIAAKLIKPMLAVGIAAFAASHASASTLVTVTSYDMPNGYGVAAGGDHNYWDTAYSHCVASECTTDGAALSGGTGLLTNGVAATHSFYEGDGVGAYVGWIADPTITFNFGAAQTINEIKLYVDNSWNSGVGAPASILIDGTEYTDPSWTSTEGPTTIDIAGLALNSASVAVTLNRSSSIADNPIYWVFLSEAQFLGPDVNTTPLPAAWPMMLVGLAGLGFGAYRKRQRAMAPALA